MSLTVPAAELAKGWLAVATASTSDTGKPALNRTVYVEQFAHGLRLTATDSYIILTAWVSEISHDLPYPEPSIDEVPGVTAVAYDQYGRASGLLAHLLRLARSEEAAEKMDLDVVVQLNVPWKPETGEGADLQLDGFQAKAVTIEHPDTEKVQLGVYEGEWVKYRDLFLGFKMQRPMRLAISQRVAGRIAKAAKVFGPETVIFQRFGGEEKPVSVLFGEAPTVSGLLMPCKWDFEKGEPWGHDDTPEDLEDLS